MSTTIRDAIIQVLELEKKPLTPEEIYQKIVERNSYEFNTDQPIHVVRTRLRRDCVGLNFQAASKVKYFILLAGDKYWLKEKAIPIQRKEKLIPPQSALNERLQVTYEEYIRLFKDELLGYLKKLLPEQFEIFCKNFIKAYGFKECRVTQKTRDGGIDGFGKYSIGVTELDVAFECKRWTSKSVGAEVVRLFRGSIPRDCVYGILFTTSEFNLTAIREAERSDLKPIVLLNGLDIVNVMIEKGFGVEKYSTITLFSNQLDQVLIRK